MISMEKTWMTKNKKFEERPPDIHVLAVVVFYETKNNHRIFLEQTRN